MLSNTKRGEKSPLLFFKKKYVMLNKIIRIYRKKEKCDQIAMYFV